MIIVKPKNWNAGEVPINTDLNSDFDTLYTDYNGNITDANIANAAAIAASKISGTAMVATGAGTQSVTKKTKFSAAGLAHDTSAANRKTYGAAAYAANVLSLTPGIRFHYFSVNDAVAYSINQITNDGSGAFADGDEIVIIAQQLGAGSITFADQSALNTANTIHLRGAANVVIATSKRGTIGLLRFGDPIAQGVNMWWQE